MLGLATVEGVSIDRRRGTPIDRDEARDDDRDQRDDRGGAEGVRPCPASRRLSCR